MATALLALTAAAYVNTATRRFQQAAARAAAPAAVLGAGADGGAPERTKCGRGPDSGPENSGGQRHQRDGRGRGGTTQQPRKLEDVTPAGWPLELLVDTCHVPMSKVAGLML